MTVASLRDAVVIGAGATLFIDVWSLFLRYAFDIRSLNYCMLGRWLLHMPGGVFVHQSIGASSAKRHECKTGWIAHYSIGVAFAVVFTMLAPVTWLERPTLIPALAFGVATVVVPFFTMQPALGLGVAAAKTPNPNAARLKSVMTHAVFGAGLFVWAVVLRIV